MADQVSARDALARKIAKAIISTGFHHHCEFEMRVEDQEEVILARIISPLLPEGDGWKERAEKAEVQAEGWREQLAQARDETEKAEADLVALKAEGGWIPCAERMPNKMQTVQIWPEDMSFPVTATYNSPTSDVPFYSRPGGWQYASKFWRPLPSPPAEGPV